MQSFNILIFEHGSLGFCVTIFVFVYGPLGLTFTFGQL